jgi:hypothetical protein
MFISFDNGAHWQSFQQNLPNVPVADLKVYRKDLVVGTQGRSFWILDNLSSLHQIDPSQSPNEVTLYEPRDGYRTRDGADILGPNIEYYLPSVPDGAVTIDILDRSGTMVNSYASQAGPVAQPGAARTDPQAMMMAGRGGGRGGFQRGAPVTRNKGHNRFVWDVQHESGLGAPPGEYQARLTVGDVTLTTPFTVLVDPRLAEEGITAADLQEQFRHNMRMRDMVAEVGVLVDRVEEAMQVTSGARALDLQAVMDKLVAGPVRYSKPGLRDHIRYLAGMTTRVDQKVGRDALERADVLRSELDAITAEVDRILGSGGR